ncbi:ABC transporter ATP-binding protein [Halobellus salinisoli]|uniref:ABC transporter ATP-binding protein n=1 Tax=Halobellus salinisoli TaxID=3108500 RepID=UPI00300936E6
MTARVDISGLRKTYGSPPHTVTAIDNFDLQVQDNEFYCLLGPSGCGKSTLLRVISGFVDYESGSVEIRDDREADKPLTNMVFQEYGIFPWKTVIANVAFGLKMRGVGKAERNEIAREYIEKVNLSGFEDSYPHQLSGGMKQRVGIARAFANDPEILLMDEPFGALDAQTKEQLQEELLDIWNAAETTAIYITHDIDEAIVLGDRVGIMSARPGTIKTTIDIDLPRPRTKAVRDSDAFTRYRNEAREVLGEEVTRAMKVNQQK